MAVLSAVSLSVAGCSAQRGLLPVTGQPPPGEPYRIQPRDQLEIRFFHTPENNVLLPVRPDGRISLPLVPEVQAAGRTVEELRQELLDRYRVELADPELAVIVQTFSVYQVHVGGEVGVPGVLELSGTHNVLDAVIAAGGFLPTADPAEVLVVRRTEAGYELLDADLDALLDGRDAGGNFALRPYDVVFVPMSPIAEVNQWVDQYIRKNVPLEFSYRINP